MPRSTSSSTSRHRTSTTIARASSPRRCACCAPAAIFCYTDGCWADDDCSEDLLDAGFELLERREITSNVLHALRKDSARRAALFDAMRNRDLREEYKHWGGVVGYRAYNRFEAGPDSLLLAPAAQAALTHQLEHARERGVELLRPPEPRYRTSTSSTPRSSATLPMRRCSLAPAHVMDAQGAVAEPEAPIGRDARGEQPAAHRRLGVAHDVVVQELDVDLLLFLQIESIEPLPFVAHARLDGELACDADDAKRLVRRRLLDVGRKLERRRRREPAESHVADVAPLIRAATSSTMCVRARTSPAGRSQTTRAASAAASKPSARSTWLNRRFCSKQ